MAHRCVRAPSTLVPSRSFLTHPRKKDDGNEQDEVLTTAASEVESVVHPPQIF